MREDLCKLQNHRLLDRFDFVLIARSTNRTRIRIVAAQGQDGDLAITHGEGSAPAKELVLQLRIANPINSI